MNTIKTLAAAIAVSAAFVGTAQAGELDWPLDAPNASSLTRQELSAAQAAGLDMSGELDYPPVAG